MSNDNSLNFEFLYSSLEEYVLDLLSFICIFNPDKIDDCPPNMLDPIDVLSL